MINYCLHFFLPRAERQLVGIDKQFETVFLGPVALACGRTPRHRNALLVSPQLPD
jgi:hypothetical protein